MQIIKHILQNSLPELNKFLDLNIIFFTNQEGLFNDVYETIEEIPTVRMYNFERMIDEIATASIYHFWGYKKGL